ncbi:MAG TPA: GtrA family protein [Candidatus Baltobacteraceae bacterium]|jgi:putative flippase GtrA|nr:GtrA family protein [Candidatus Baltobacteraceae bacterium]
MRIHALAHRLYADASWPFQLARYVFIGGFVTCLDLGSFVLFLHAGWPLLAVITASWAIAVATHFSLNKYVNFRAHDRPTHQQMVTYAVISAVTWLTTIAIVKGAISLGASPVAGKVLAIAFNVPIGFFGHRYLTFGRGIVATARHLLGRR